MKKRKLQAELEYNFDLYGILSALKEYKLAWRLNNALNIQLDKQQDIEIDFLKSQNLVISNFLYETEHSQIRLLKNRSVDQFEEHSVYMVPELKKFDYLMTVQGYDDTYNSKQLKNIFVAIPGIQYVQTFAASDLKSRENLIF